jgi:hypothetical protein
MTKIIIANIKEKLNQQQYVKKKYFVQMKKLLLQMTRLASSNDSLGGYNDDKFI